MPIYKSTNLKEWQFLGFKYSMKDAKHYDKIYEIAQNSTNPNIQKDGLKLWAPEIHYIRNRWVYIHTSNVGVGNFVVCNPDTALSSKFTDWGDGFGKNHDPSLFIDDDGSIYMTAGCTFIQKIKNDLSGFEGSRINIGPSNRKLGHEGTFIKKIEGKYVLFGTAWSTDTLRKGTYNLYYCVADNIYGPYGERKFAGRFLGHGTLFQDKNGEWWCTAFYNANKPTMTFEEISQKDVSDNAYTINKQGLTLVPMSVKKVGNDIQIVPKDAKYVFSGKEEVQKF